MAVAPVSEPLGVATVPPASLQETMIGIAVLRIVLALLMRAFFRELLAATRIIVANIPMMAITIKSSIKVKALLFFI
jgi:membrane protein implicated in regulation of membrane protease activity